MNIGVAMEFPPGLTEFGTEGGGEGVVFFFSLLIEALVRPTFSSIL